MLSKRLFSELYTCKYYTTYWFRARWEKSLFFSIANHNLITSSIQKYVDFLTDRSCHTTNLRVPQGRETPCCISLLQQGGFHTTGILQTNRNTWIQGTRKTFKSSKSYTISRKITTYHIVARQFSALGAGCRRFESCHSDQSPLKSEDFRGLFFGYCGAKFEGLTDDAFP